MHKSISLQTKIFKALALSLLISGTALAQPIGSESGPRSSQINSPYSRYGIGDLQSGLSAELRAMGSVVNAATPGLAVNTANPASYSFLNSATLDAAFEAGRKTVTLGGKNTRSGTGNFAYFNLGMSAGKHVGLNIGFKPMANMFYNANDTLNIAGLGTTIRNFNGTGNLQYAFLGISGQYRGISLGTNIGYAFGSYEYVTSLKSTGVDTAGEIHSDRSTQISVKDNQGGFYWSAGALYHATINKTQYLNVGVNANLSQNLNINRENYSLAYHYLNELSGASMIVDTVSHIAQKGKLVLPATYGIGVVYGKTANWEAGADFNYTNWSIFENFGNRDGVGDNSWRLGVGGAFTPDAASPDRKYLSYVTYRLGAYFGKDYYNLRNTDVNYFGGTIGVSLPLQRNYNNFGRINMAMDIGQRGTVVNGLAKEVYVNFTFGLTLNDNYWLKRPAHYK